MKRFFVKFFAVIGIMTVISILITTASVIVALKKRPTLPQKMILKIDFEHPFAEYAPPNPLSRILDRRELSILDLIQTLESAGKDDRVVGLVARVGVSGMGMARVQEIRDAIGAFRRNGKSAVAYAETLGEAGPGSSAYYLATAFDRIYLQPSGDVGLTGFMSETPFLKGTLDKLGIEPRLDHRWEYKNMMNMFTQKSYTEAHREATRKIVDSLYNQFLEDVAKARRMKPEKLAELVDKGPFYGKEALDAGLVDALAYRDEVLAQVKDDADSKADFISLGTYINRALPPKRFGKTIALIYGVGNVHRGSSENEFPSDSQSMGSDTVAAAFRAAVKDEDVKAIIFRVDSPGGSYVASDAIWREVVRAKQAGKPVIATMGDVAGSGGYFVAMAANKIVAQPGTLTGSIGVLGGKMLTKGFWEKLGVTWAEVHAGENAGTYSGTIDYSEAQWQRFQDWLNRVYEDFTAKAAQGRGMELARLKAAARGRVWTGRDAKALGLVDELGGFPKALNLAKEAAGIDADDPIDLKLFPKEKPFVQQLLNPGGESAVSVLRGPWQVLDKLKPLLRLTDLLTREDQELAMEQVQVR